MHAPDGGFRLLVIDFVSFQVGLEAALVSMPQVAAFMGKEWSWPLTESAHFIGLTLLFGSILAWDLRLLGFANRVPVAAFHRLVPFAVLGFAINVCSGALFLMTDADQYVYNPAFHLKMLCVALAGVNVVIFYLTVFRRARVLAPGAPAPLAARLSGGVSIALWATVIVCGRMITFYRPTLCSAGEPLGFLASCIVR